MILDLFAGAGGWDEGARMAGFQGRILGVELDHAACRTGVAAGHWRVRADVATFPLRHLAGRVAGVVLSPPCPTWSAAGDGAGKVDIGNVLRLIADYAAGREPGVYGWVDTRSALTAQPMRYVAELAPRWIALEQVPPVLPIWQYTAELLRKRGYRTWCGVLSAEEYGVPQTRKRAILVASLDGPVGPPAPTHQAYVAGRAPEVDDDLFGSPLPPPVSMATALGWNESARVVSNYGTGGDSQARGERTGAEPAATVTSKVDRNVVYLAPAGVTSQTRPSTTVLGDARIGHPGHKGREQRGESMFAEGSVRVTVQEAGILQGFRADYPWLGTKSEQYLQCGNAVPPPVAAAVLRPLLASFADREVAA